jgi:hypothetical protein
MFQKRVIFCFWIIYIFDPGSTIRVPYKQLTYKVPRRYPYFDVVVGLAWSYDPESYAGGSVAAGSSPMPDRSKVMIQTERDTLALQVGGWAWG